MSLEQEVLDGRTAQRLLDDEQVTAVLASIEAAQFSRFKEAKSTNDDLRAIWGIAQGIEKLRERLRALVGQGERAAQTLADQQKKAERERSAEAKYRPLAAR